MESIFGEAETAVNPYVEESYINRKYDVLQKAYNLDSEFVDRKGKTDVLLVGVGRGYAALEMSIRYPNLLITAVNKEKHLFDSRLISDYFKMFYSEEIVDNALARITLKIADIENEESVSGAYDVIVFETNVLMYIRDKFMTLEKLFNKSLKRGGSLFFETDAVFGSQQMLDNREGIAAPDMILHYVGEALAEKGHLFQNINKSYFYQSNNYKIGKTNDSSVLFPVALHADLTAFQSIMAKNSNRLMVDASVAPFLSVYFYKKRKLNTLILGSS